MNASQQQRRLAAAIIVLGFAGATAATTASAAPGNGGAQSERAIKADKSPPLRSMAAARQPVNATAPQVRHRNLSANSASPLLGTPVAPLGVDSVQQTQAPSRAAPATLTSWDGVSNRDAVVPPDTEGDVGPNDYVQWVNLSFEIWSKTGTVRLGPVEGNTLWSGFGGTGDLCANNNQGDPVVVYDRLADRWMFTQFGFAGTGSTGPYVMCVAVSQTGDPTGAYYRFEFPINTANGDFPDYPKVGVWPDGYYMTTNNFAGNTFDGAGFYAFDRAKMLVGDSSATMVTFAAPGTQYEGVLPATLTGPTSPPAGSPEYFGAVDTSSSSGTGSTFQIWRAHPDFTTPANSTLSAVTNVAVAPYTFSFCSSLAPTGCIPQPGTTRVLDPLADRLMFRLQYRNFGDHETLVASHTVNVGSGSDRAGVRWYEIRSPGSSPAVYQQGTFAPSDGVNRWMGSAAMDGNGNIALGYSASDGTSTFPSIYYTGRLASDALGTMTQGEGRLAVGAGSQTTRFERWGDYSAMSIDPTDDKTLWYTQEYYSATSAEGWSTRIGSFRLETGPTVTLTTPANGAFTNNSSPTFSGTAGTAAGDTNVTVNIYSGSSVGGTPVQTRTATVASDGTWSVAASPSLADGTYTARAQQSDSSSDTGVSNANTFTVDTAVPTVTLTAPANGSFTNNTAPTFSGTATTGGDESTTVTVKVYSGSTASGTPVQTRPATVGAGGSWSVAASPALTPGIYTAQAQQGDTAGNTGFSAANTFTVDTTAPAVTLSAPSNGSFTNNTTPTFTGTATTGGDESTTVTVKVYSGSTASGTPVQTRTASVGAGGSWSVAASSALTPGTYTAQAQQGDTAGNTGFSSANTFTIDTTAPTVALTAPANASFTNNTTPTFSGTATTGSDESTTVTVKLYAGSGTGGALQQTLTTTESGGNWSVPASSALSPGTYTAQAQQSDAAGNTGFSSANTFTIDTTAPVVTLATPTNGTLTNNTTPTFSGTATTGGDESTTVTVTIYSGTGTGGTVAQTRTATVSAGSWSVAASPALGDGTYTAQARQSDAAGNTGFSSANTFTIHTTAPAVTLTSPTAGSYTNNTTPTFTGTATNGGDESTTVTVKIYAGSTAGGTPAQTLSTTESSGSWSVPASSALAQGTYTAQAQQSDAAGNTGFSSAVTFNVDTTNPAVTLSAPANAAFTKNTTPTFSGTATTGGDESTTITVKVYSGSTASGTPVQTLATTESGGNWSVPASSALTDGTYTAQAQQSDAAGNTGFSAANTFTVDTVAPTVTLSSPTNNAFMSTSTPTFSGTATTGGDESTTVTVKVYSGSTASGTPVQTLTTTESGGNWSVPASSSLADGTYTAQAQQSDAAGNTGTSNANTFTINSTAPPVTLSSPTNGSFTNSTAPTFSGTAGSAASGDSAVTVKVYSGTGTGGTLLQTLTATLSGTNWSATASPALAQGSYTVQAQQTNPASVTGFSAANTFTVDTTAPTVTLTAPTNGSFTKNTTPTFTGTATTGGDESTTVTVRIYSGTGTGGTLVQTRPAAVAGDGSWSVAASPSLADGTYTAQAQQTDAAGNSGTSAAQTFTIDTATPAVTLASPANGAATKNTTPTFTGTAATGGDESTTVMVKVYSGSTASGTALQTLTTTESGGNWSVPASSALSDGTYTAQAQQSDTAGNTGFSAASTFTVDTVAPIVMLTSPANNSSTTNQTPTFSGTAGTAPGDAPSVTVLVYSGSTLVGAPLETLAVSVSSGAFSIPASSPLAPGPYVAQAQQSDAADNVGTSAADSFTILTAPPPSTPTSSPPPSQQTPLIAYLQVPKQRLGSALKRGIRLAVGANAAGRATLETMVDGSAARRLARRAASRRAPKPVLIRTLRVTLTRPGTVDERVTIKRHTARVLRGVRRLALTFHLTVTDRSGRSKSLTTHVVLSP